ncbi:hypothetical protein QAD02_023344 [Eretmocerus hayati]|uniref:Uncharacterized protein n=1 Tax=Eretmocerus hayati TaxID=131215 RepID=A0ACC2PVC9_9HYME|nr:hypothetical protein QAD02_023344 [Eretmocerus hayati]
MQRLSTRLGESEEDDYSASACAIIQRRNSSRRHSRRRRRPSSPFSSDVAIVAAAAAASSTSEPRRRSSVFTTSSADSGAVSVQEDSNSGPISSSIPVATSIPVSNISTTVTTSASGTVGTPPSLMEEQMFERLRLHKEVLSGVKQQPWPLRRKLRLVRQAKAYVRKHEGALQQRLAHARSTRDVLARASILVSKRWQHFKRELINFKTVLVPWEHRIKQIESQFGSAVASYFIFLRWLFWFNIVLSAILVTFVVIPELLATLQKATIAGERKIMLPEEKLRANHLLTLWEFEGSLKYSPFFYGWYSNRHTYASYNLPLAYFVVNLIVYTYSFVAILRKMAKNSRMSKLSEKEDECVFSWKLFTGWDFMIGNAETAQNRIGSIVLGLKEALLEESEKHRDERNWKIISIRIMVNLLVMAMLVVSAYAVVEIVERSENVRESDSSWWRQNEITVVLTLITYTFPIAFEILGIIESYHPRKQLRLQLGRIMILNLLNMYSLIYALFKKINSSGEKLQSLKPKSPGSTLDCFERPVPCESNGFYAVSTLAAMSLVLSANFSVPSTRKPDKSVELISTKIPHYTIPNTVSANEESLSSTKQNFPLSSFDMNYFFENWTLNNSAEIEIELPPYNDSTNTNQTDSNKTDSIINTDCEEMQNPLIEQNFIEKTDEDVASGDERIITADDDYPHVNYDDFGYSSSENKSEGVIYHDATSSSISHITEGAISTTEVTPSVNLVLNATKKPPDDQMNDLNHELLIDKLPSSCEESKKIVRCYERVCENRTLTFDHYSVSTKSLDMKTRRMLRGLCWETMFGQELAKLTMMDLVLTILSIMGIDFFRALFVRYMNSCWCWDLEKQFPQYGDFKIAENILHLVNNQGMVWMGIFFSPGLIVLNVVKLVILMYLRSWTVLTCNVPHDVVFRASRSNNFYLALLLTMLFLCVLPVGYAIVWVEPSWHCGPFSGNTRIYYLATSSLRRALPSYILDYKILDYIASPGIVIPLLVLMTLIIYYMVSLTNSLRESNNDLKFQLRKERTEERRKMFRIAEKRLDSNDTPFSRWKKILPNATIKSVDVTLGNDALVMATGSPEICINSREVLNNGGSKQLPDSLPIIDADSLEQSVAANIDRRVGWRSDPATQVDYPNIVQPSISCLESGVLATTIPRIQISVDEPNGRSRPGSACSELSEHSMSRLDQLERGADLVPLAKPDEECEDDSLPC